MFLKFANPEYGYTQNIKNARTPLSTDMFNVSQIDYYAEIVILILLKYAICSSNYSNF